VSRRGRKAAFPGAGCGRKVSAGQLYCQQRQSCASKQRFGAKTTRENKQEYLPLAANSTLRKWSLSFKAELGWKQGRKESTESPSIKKAFLARGEQEETPFYQLGGSVGQGRGQPQRAFPGQTFPRESAKIEQKQLSK